MPKVRNLFDEFFELEYDQNTIIGTAMVWWSIKEFSCDSVSRCDYAMTKCLREVCVARGYFKKTFSRKVNFWEFKHSSLDALADGREVLIRTFQTGVTWRPEVALQLANYRRSERNARMSVAHQHDLPHMRARFISELSNELGDCLLKVDLLK